MTCRLLAPPFIMVLNSGPLALVCALALLANVLPAVSDPLPSTYPHNYTGIPTSELSPAWQNCAFSVSGTSNLTLTNLADFLVTDKLPNVTFPLGRSFAGNIPVERDGHPNNTLFFWGFEKQNGSLTTNSSINEPWGIWLNGG